LSLGCRFNRTGSSTDDKGKSLSEESSEREAEREAESSSEETPPWRRQRRRTPYETQIWNEFARAQAYEEAEAAAKAAGCVSRSSSTHEPASSSSNKAHMEVEHYTTKDGMYDL